MMRTFKLYRQEDVNGKSGTGFVAEGISFTDGTAVMNWTTATPSLGVYKSIEELERIHGHEGRTWIVWEDEMYGPAR